MPEARSSAETPVDRALRLALEGDKDAALRTAAALLKQRLDAPVPLFVTAWLLAEGGQSSLARGGFEVCAERGADAGNLPIAVAALCELRRLGADPESRIDAIASDYAKGSPRLSQSGVGPPSMVAARENFSPLPDRLSGKLLTQEVSQILEYARASLDGDRAGGAAPTSVPPQRLFSSLGAKACAGMMRACTTKVVPAGDALIEEGTIGEEAFIVARGELEVTKETGDGTVLLARLGNGAVFGEMSLMSRAARAATVRAVVPSVVLVFDQDAINRVAVDAPEVASAFGAYCRQRMVQNLVRTSAILGAFKNRERIALMEKFVSKSYEKGETVIRQGGTAEGLHLIASGQVVITRDENNETVVITRLGVGEVVGEVAMVLRRPANANVIAEMPTVTMHLPHDEFMGLIRAHPTLLAQLYELAVQRDEETSNIVAQEAAEADELLI